MPYIQKEKSTGLDLLTTLSFDDLHIVGDVADNGRAKAITQGNLEIVFANSQNFINELINNNYFTTNLALNTNFIDELIANSYFITNLAGDTNFINNLTNNSLFQSNVNNFITNISGGGGGTKIAINTNETSNNTTTPVNAFTIPIPGGILGTNNGFKFKLSGSMGSGVGNGEITIIYGGESLGTISFNGTAEFLLTGVVLADNSTGDQKAQLSFSVDGNTEQILNSILTVDGTISQDLIVSIVTDNSRVVTVESIAVEAIRGLGLGKVLIDTTQQVVLANLGNDVDIYTVPIPAGILGTNNAIKFSILYSALDLAQGTGVSLVKIKYGSQTLVTGTIMNAMDTVSGIFSGYIVADNDSQKQKAQLILGAERSGVADANFVTSAYGTGTEDSSVLQNLVISINNNTNVSASITAEAIIVESIA